MERKIRGEREMRRREKAGRRCGNRHRHEVVNAAGEQDRRGQIEEEQKGRGVLQRQDRWMDGRGQSGTIVPSQAV